MDEVFNEVDRTYSSAGESVLYTMLRNPMMDEEKINKRSNIIDLFNNDLDLTIKLRCIFFKLGFDNKNRLIEMINGLLSVNKTKFYIYSFLGVLPVILILSAILFRQPYFMVILTFYVYIIIHIHIKESVNIKALGLVYLRDLITGAKSLSKVENDELKVYLEEI